MPRGNIGTAPALVTLPEWNTTTVTGASLSDRDRRLAEALQSQGRLVVDELVSGLRIQTRAWVGIVRFDSLLVRITPKLAGDALGVAQMLAFTRGTEELRRSAGVQSIMTAETTDLLELLAALLAEAAERVVQGGLFAGYQEHEDELTAVRGRLLVDRQVLSRFGRADRVLCLFDELEHDTDENRLLALALQLCARRVRREHLHRRLRYLVGLFAEVCSPELVDLASARMTLTYDRQNAHYREAHDLAWLILEGFGVVDVLAVNAPTQCFAFLLDMNALFEEFVWRLLVRLFPSPGFRVDPQERNWSVLWDAVAHRPYRSIRPDVVVRQQREPLVSVTVDAKYKRYDVKKVSGEDLYQGFLYSQAYGNPAGDAVPISVLVHPTERAQPHAEIIRLRRAGRQRVAEVIVVGLPVRSTIALLDAFEASPAAVLRKLIERGFGDAQHGDAAIGMSNAP